MRPKIDINRKALHFGWCVLAVIIFGLVFAIRIRLLGIPLERDEGEYAYAGQLMLQGIPPYKLAYNMKFPGTYAAYAVIMSIFGQTISWGSSRFAFDKCCDERADFLSRQATDGCERWQCCGCNLRGSIDKSVSLGVRRTRCTLCNTAGSWWNSSTCCTRTDRPAFGRLFATGLLFGLGSMMKQPGACFVPFAVIYLIWKERQDWRSLSECSVKIVIFSCGVIVPFAMTCLLLWSAGVFKQFWFWTIDYAREYGSLVPLSEVPRLFV